MATLITLNTKGETLTAMISYDGRTPREYPVTVHENCKGNGYKFVVMSAWSDDVLCTGCDLFEYNGIGD